MKSCFLCKKGSALGGRRSFLRSHYNPTARVRKYPNLQWATLPAEALPDRQAGLAKAGFADRKRVKICAKCLKTINRTK